MNSVQYEVQVDLEDLIDENTGDVVTYIVDNYHALVREELTDLGDWIGIEGIKDYIKKGDQSQDIKEELVNVFFQKYKSEILEKLFANV